MFPLADGSLRQPGGNLRKRSRVTQSQKPENSDENEQDGEAGVDPATNPDPIPEYEKDYWHIAGNSLIRVHRTPRKWIFSPTDAPDLPVPLEFLDITRCTETDLEDIKDRYIFDLWPEGDPELPEQWVGRTSFEFRRPVPP